MKRLSLVLAFVFASGMIFAQKGKVNAAASNLRSGKLDKAKELIDAGITHKKCIEWPKSYYVKGQVYQGIFESPMDMYKKLSDNPLEIAYDAYKKCIELDVKKKFKSKLKTQLNNLSIDYAGQGATQFNENNYEGAYKSFKTALEIQDNEIVKSNKIDTAIIYYTALAAYNLKKFEEAIPYYEEALKHNYEAAKCYAALAYSYKELKQEEKAIEYLHKGYELYPDNLYMLGQLINYYLLGGEPEKAEKYLDAAIEQDPSNMTFYRAKGTLYEKIDRPDDAIKMYEKALEIDPKDFISIYNIGLIRVKVIEAYQKEVNDIMDNDKYNEGIKKLTKMYEEVIPVFERAHEANPKEIIIVQTLKELCFRLRNSDPKYLEKYNKFKELEASMEAK